VRRLHPELGAKPGKLESSVVSDQLALFEQFCPRHTVVTSSGENRTRNSQSDAHSSGLKNNRRKSGF
jgi:hypothetical protein